MEEVLTGYQHGRRRRRRKGGGWEGETDDDVEERNKNLDQPLNAHSLVNRRVAAAAV